MVSAADWVKLNSEEFDQLHSSADGASFIADYRLQGLVLTHGEAGAEVITTDGERIRVQSAQNSHVMDTVGAGDAFSSVMILGLANDWPLETTVRRAQAFASSLVGHRGATVSDPGFYRVFIDEWKLKA